jgi:hypothetical protein
MLCSPLHCFVREEDIAKPILDNELSPASAVVAAAQTLSAQRSRAQIVRRSRHAAGAPFVPQSGIERAWRPTPLIAGHSDACDLSGDQRLKGVGYP